MIPVETERKFLVKKPETDWLEKSSTDIYQIEQTYLKSEETIAERVRKRIGKTTQYFHTTKRRISPISCFEDEEEISEQQYHKFLERKDPAGETIHKTRFCIPLENGLKMEVDCYSFWKGICTVEVEMPSEKTEFSLPTEINVIRDVSGEKRFSNKSLYFHIPGEEDLLV